MKRLTTTVFLLVCICGLAQAREPGHYAPGAAYLRDFAVPPQSGFYYEQYNVYYWADNFKDRNGDSVSELTIGSTTVKFDADVDSWSITPTFMWVTEKKILGGDYALYVSPTIASNDVSANLSAINRGIDFDTDNTGLWDLYVQPLWLGWRDKRYDLSFGMGLYLPIGEYESDASNSIGLGFMTLLTQAAGYLYLDQQQASALALIATYEIHSQKLGTDITPGDHFTLEYGFSQYFSQRLEVSISGFSQWQVEGDKGNDILLDGSVKTEVHGIGGQISYSFTPRFNMALRYMIEYNAKARFEGQFIALNFFFTPKPMF